MSTLYKPVLIETAGQAAVLPDAAIVIGVETGERYTRAPEGDWWGVTEMGTSIAVDLASGDAVMALVPIEAEEEAGKTFPPGRPETTHFRVGGPEGVRHLRDGWDVTDEVEAWEATRRTRTRYVTPWTITEES